MIDELYDPRKKHAVLWREVNKNTIFEEEIKMNVMVKHVIEIAGGLLVGGLMSDAVNAVGKKSKKVVENFKAKKKGAK